MAAVLTAAGGEGPAVAVATVVESSGEMPLGTMAALTADGDLIGELPPALADGLRPAMAAALAGHASTTLRVDTAEGHVDVLIEVTEPPEELIVVGGGHIGRSLSLIGAHLGLAVTVIDDRETYANRERFPEAARVICGDFVDSLRSLRLGPSTYVVVVTRGHKQDELALAEVVGNAARYVGMIGSKRRVRAVMQHLEATGISPELLALVHSPIGVDIGAETPEEIAVSILAEIVRERRVSHLMAARRRRGNTS